MKFTATKTTKTSRDGRTVTRIITVADEAGNVAPRGTRSSKTMDYVAVWVAEDGHVISAHQTLAQAMKQQWGPGTQLVPVTEAPALTPERRADLSEQALREVATAADAILPEPEATPLDVVREAVLLAARASEAKAKDAERHGSPAAAERHRAKATEYLAALDQVEAAAEWAASGDTH